MEFEWGPTKAISNLQKHGISFASAITVFDDPNHIIEDSTKPERKEIRMSVIGMVGHGIIVTVIYTDREHSRCIISARRARRNERKRYDQGKTTS